MGKRRNGEGTWGIKTIRGIEYRFYRNPDGKYFYGKTEREVREKLKKYKPLLIDDKSIRKEYFGDYVADWLENVKRPKIKRHTYDGYEDCITGQLLNYKYNNLSDIQVGSITTLDINRYYTSLAEHYSKGTIKKNYAILSQCIKYGNKYNHFSEPIDLDDISIPHNDVIKKQTREVQFLSDDDMKKLYEESKRINVPGFNFGGKIGDLTYGNNAKLLMFIMFTGLRIGEAIDLKWSNVELGDSPRVHVTSSSVQLKNRNKKTNTKYIEESTTTKSYSGERYVPLNQTALEILEYEDKLNPNHNSTDYVFITENRDKIKSRQNVNRTLRDMLVRSGCSVQNCTPHGLRHSFGSALLRKGVDIKVVSKLLGHKDITVTYNVYIHILKEQEIEAVSGLTELFTDIKKEGE